MRENLIHIAKFILYLKFESHAEPVPPTALAVIFPGLQPPQGHFCQMLLTVRTLTPVISFSSDFCPPSLLGGVSNPITLLLSIFLKICVKAISVDRK